MRTEYKNLLITFAGMIWVLGLLTLTSQLYILQIQSGILA